MSRKTFLMVETERWQRLSKIGIIELRTDRILGWVERNV